MLSPEIEFDTWEYNTYHTPNSPDTAPSVIPFEDIQCQVARGTTSTTNPKIWMTTILDRVCILLFFQY